MSTGGPSRVVKRSANYVYDLVGKIQQVSDPTGTYAFAYDNMGRLIGTTTQYSFLPGHNFQNSYAYDAASGRTGLAAPDGSTDSYNYDALNRLTTLSNSLTGQFGFGHDALSRRTFLQRPNGLNTNYSYNNLSELLSILHQTGTAVLDGAGYAYDPAGNQTSKVDFQARVTSNYSYDPLNRLTQVTKGGGTTESYTYDPVGNRLSSQNLSTYNYNASNELTSTSGGAYTYDANGSTLTDASSRSYVWDFENRLVSAAIPRTGTVAFKYDPLGRRIQKLSPLGTSNYVYDGDRVIEELDAAGNILARYTQGPEIDEPLAQVRSSATSYFESDGLSSVTSLSNGAAALTQTYTYDSFGNLVASTGAVTNPFQYTGREFDSETGLYYDRARYYDPIMGRFISEDPTEFGGGINFYSYVHNNPTKYRDPSGKFYAHGFWCGPNWTGGLYEPYNPDHDSQYMPPIDPLDTACMHHDKCYYQCRKDNPCDKSARRSCMRNCDVGLLAELPGVAEDGQLVSAGIGANWLWPSADDDAKDCSCKKASPPPPPPPCRGWGCVDNR